MPISVSELREIIEELENIRGRHTELVTVLIPAGANIYTIADQIAAEQSTADNIKSKTVRKNVTDALEMVGRELKKYKQTLPNGMAIFCGNVSDKEGEQDLKLWIVEPSQSLKTRMYRCDQVFVLEPLKEMLEAEEVYGLVVMDKREATIGLLEGKQIKVLRKMTSGIPGKYKTGGQSAARFERIRDGLAKDFYRRIADSMKECFFNLPKLKGILIGGPIPSKEEFIADGQLNNILKDKIIATKDLGNTDESGLEDLVKLSQEELSKQEIIKEQKILERFFQRLGKEDKVAYKKEDVDKALKYGAVQTLILSNKLHKSVVSEYSRRAQETSAEVEFVSTETPEGDQFFNIGGVGALLRFEI